jgi:hypothetical protein
MPAATTHKTDRLSAAASVLHHAHGRFGEIGNHLSSGRIRRSRDGKPEAGPGPPRCGHPFVARLRSQTHQESVPKTTTQTRRIQPVTYEFNCFSSNLRGGFVQSFVAVLSKAGCTRSFFGSNAFEPDQTGPDRQLETTDPGRYQPTYNPIAEPKALTAKKMDPSRGPKFLMSSDVTLERKTGFEPATLTLANRWSSLSHTSLTSIYPGQQPSGHSASYLSTPLVAPQFRSKWHESGTTSKHT